MYVLLRRDLEWPAGAVINQACHLSTAVTWEAREDPEAIAFCSEVEGQMTNVTMGASDEAQLRKVAEKLMAKGIPLKLWVEQPEDMAVGLATWPRRRSVARSSAGSLRATGKAGRCGLREVSVRPCHSRPPCTRVPRESLKASATQAQELDDSSTRK